MIQFDLPKQKSSIIKVIGVGGGGSNAVNFMYAQDIEGVDFIVCNTDAKAIEQSKIPNKIQLGPFLTQGLGAGANPEVGKKATEESLDEIRKILEVNTKMAFITVGMGGGTGTGGAPIIAKVCKELGILTVGIVTTPFSFEGPRRKVQAEEGINQLTPYVDTLLVISNDKLRMQYGNLKMKEAFCKADNVLATAAKCITDIINSRGHIIVDFADVCTVMKNGGSAILGKAEIEGEDRAQRAIEEALASPLLNDSDIKGAKWILININSAEGDHECTMDELDVINSYLRMQAGEKTDVIVGMGYDNSLDKKIGITLIATGFEARNPFETREQAVASPILEKIVMTLGAQQNAPAQSTQATNVVPSYQQPTVIADAIAPKLQQNNEAPFLTTQKEAQQSTFSEVPNMVNGNSYFELKPTIEAVQQPVVAAEEKTVEPPIDETLRFVVSEKPATGSVINKPTNIYAQHPIAQEPQQPVWNQPKPTPPAVEVKLPEPPPFIATPAVPTAQVPPTPPAEPALPKFDVYERSSQPTPPPVAQAQAKPTHVATDLSEEEQRRRSQERIQKLRTLSYNTNPSDPNNEFEMVPAYIRQKIDLLGNAFASADDFYSKVTVNTDENNQNGAQLSSLNTFLEGKKPD